MRITKRGLLGILLACGAGVGCSDLSGLAGKQAQPSGIPDPNSLHNAAGAVAEYQSVIAAFQAGRTFEDLVIESGMLTDELGWGSIGGFSNAVDFYALLDTRQLPDGSTNLDDPVYAELHGIRNSANLAAVDLATYDTSGSPALRGHLHALAGYSELFLADLYCSGVPLSTLDPKGDFTYRAGSTTVQLYQSAIAQFDTAIALSGDSLRFMNLARVGKGRAYLALGQYEAAATAVNAVPTDYVYQFSTAWGGTTAPWSGAGPTVADTQGGTGLPYRSGGDPRTLSLASGRNSFGVPRYWPAAYGGGTALVGALSPVSLVRVASGIEARLIEAEAALKAVNPSWLTTLNTLRTSGGVTVDTVADTLGVTQCNVSGRPTICGDQFGGAEGDTPAYGQPVGGFVPPAGFTYAGTDTVIRPPTPLPPEIGGFSGTCYSYSYYTPCYNDNLLVVQYYTKPKANPDWSAGTGGVAGLAPLTDPGSSTNDTARVNVLFRERAYWLFLTGHRQGDLRRLIRNYGYSRDVIYPTGRSLVPLIPQYGEDVDVPIPTSERSNPLFTGCFARGS